jgi:hypothetical protein
VFGHDNVAVLQGGLPAWRQKVSVLLCAHNIPNQIVSNTPSLVTSLTTKREAQGLAVESGPREAVQRTVYRPARPSADAALVFSLDDICAKLNLRPNPSRQNVLRRVQMCLCLRLC